MEGCGPDSGAEHSRVASCVCEGPLARSLRGRKQAALECKFQMMDCPTATSGDVLLRTPPMGELELLNVADMGSSMFMLPPPIGDMRWEKLAGGVPTAAEAEVSGMGTARGIEARDSGWRKIRGTRAREVGGGRGGRPGRDEEAWGVRSVPPGSGPRPRFEKLSGSEMKLCFPLPNPSFSDDRDDGPLLMLECLPSLPSAISATRPVVRHARASGGKRWYNARQLPLRLAPERHTRSEPWSANSSELPVPGSSSRSSTPCCMPSMATAPRADLMGELCHPILLGLRARRCVRNRGLGVRQQPAGARGAACGVRAESTRVQEEADHVRAPRARAPPSDRLHGPSRRGRGSQWPMWLHC